MYILLSMLPILWFAHRIDALSPETAKSDPQSELRREELLKDPFLNLKGALALGSAAFLIVGAVTLLAHEYAKAFPSKQQFSKSSFKQLLQSVRDFKWQFITMVAVIASVAVTVILLLVPNEWWWLRIVAVVALFVLLFLILHDPRYIYRRFAFCMGLCLAGTQIGMTLFVKTPEVVVETSPIGESTEEGQPTTEPTSVNIDEGTLLLHFPEPGWSFHVCMTIVIIALLVADWNSRHEPIGTPDSDKSSVARGDD